MVHGKCPPALLPRPRLTIERSLLRNRTRHGAVAEWRHDRPGSRLGRRARGAAGWLDRRSTAFDPGVPGWSVTARSGQYSRNRLHQTVRRHRRRRNGGPARPGRPSPRRATAERVTDGRRERRIRLAYLGDAEERSHERRPRMAIARTQPAQQVVIISSSVSKGLMPTP